MGRLKRSVWTVRAHAKTMLLWACSVASLTIGALTFAAKYAQDPEFTLRVTIPLWLVSLFTFLFGIRAYRKARTRHLPERTPQQKQIWNYDPPYDSWTPLGTGRAHAIYSPELNRRLAAEDEIRVTVKGKWKPRGRATDHYALLPKEEKKYRLESDLLPDTTSVRLQKTDYAAFRVTNRLAYEFWWDRKTGVPGLTFADVEQSGSLPVLLRSNCSNHIGGDILAIGDGFLFLQLQETTNGMYPGKWVGSASGSFNRWDLTWSYRLQDLVKKGLLRELKEEMRLHSRQVPKRNATKVIGYSRATYLGGKPQFYGICRIGDVTPRLGERYVRRFERLEFQGGASGLIKALDEFAAIHDGRLAPPLEMLIEVTRKWLLDDPDAASWLWPHRQQP